MGLLDPFRSRRRTRTDRRPDPASSAYLTAWARQHRGVEAYLEPRTYVTEPTVVLIAYDGKWTRRRMSAQAARQLGRRLGIPVYDVALVGYPQRMRDYTARLAREG